MAKNTIYDYSTSAVSNTDIAGIGTQGTNFVSNFDDAFRTIMAQIAVDVSPRRFAIQGALFGLTLANNAGDAVNDIDIAIGMATTDSTTDPRTMVLGTAITKRLDAAWAVGTNNGGLDTGSIANTTYFVWLIQRSDTGVVDALFSISATSPTMPASYDRKRRIGAVIRVAAALLPFIQHEDTFWHNNATNGGILDVNSVNPGTSQVTRTLTVPIGIAVDAIINLGVNNTSAAASVTTASALELPAVTAGSTVAHGLWNSTTGVVPTVSTRGQVRTNTSGQIRTNTNVSGASITLQVATLGWVDVRGRLA